MADWTKLQLLDNVDLVDDAQGRYASARYRMAAADRGAEPKRGDPADALMPGWQVDRVALTAYAPQAYYVAIVARPRVAVGSSFEQASLQGDFRVRYARSDLYFSAAVLGIKPVPPKPASGVWEAAHVTLDGSVGVPGHVPIQRSPGDASYLLDWGAAVAQVPAGCPFTAIPAWGLYGQSVRCEQAIITFHVRATFLGRYLDCLGVNDGTAASLPAKFRLPDADRPGTWRLVDQTLDALRDGDGNDFWRITRVVQRVPPVTDTAGQVLAWDPARNGGTLRWLRGA